MPTTVPSTGEDSRRSADVTDDTALPDSLAELYERYAAPLTRFCAGRLRDPHSASDAAHETILRAHRAASRFRAGARVWPWLATIAANVCSTMNSMHGRVTLTAEPPESQVCEMPHDEVVRLQQRELVTEAMGRLPVRDQTLLYLREVDGWSWQELSDLQGRTVPSIRNALWRARGALRTAVVAVSRERHWPLPAAIGVLWSRFWDRATRTGIRVETTAARISRHEGLLALLTSGTTGRIAAGAGAAVIVVVPLALGPANSDPTHEDTATHVVVHDDPPIADDPAELEWPDLGPRTDTDTTTTPAVDPPVVPAVDPPVVPAVDPPVDPAVPLDEPAILDLPATDTQPPLTELDSGETTPDGEVPEDLPFDDGNDLDVDVDPSPELPAPAAPGAVDEVTDVAGRAP